ncbi:MAG: hypothetical protein JNK82_40020 [Myxococcaceae bacterium]|nr:hypothetical protein [Myxococcaceae bacterium]
MRLHELINHKPTPAAFIATRRYFHQSEFLQATGATVHALKYHLTAGSIFSIRRGTYVSKFVHDHPDPFLLGSRLVSDLGALGYLTALCFHLNIRTKQVTLISGKKLPSFEYDGVTYRTVREPRVLDSVRGLGDDVVTHLREGLFIGVCSFERAFVDCLHRLDLGPELGPLVELLRSRESFDVDAMIRHALRLEDRVTAARLGRVLLWHPKFHLRSPEVRELLSYKPDSVALMDPSVPFDECVHDTWWRLRVPAALWYRYAT